MKKALGKKELAARMRRNTQIALKKRASILSTNTIGAVGPMAADLGKRKSHLKDFFVASQIDHIRPDMNLKEMK